MTEEASNPGPQCSTVVAKFETKLNQLIGQLQLSSDDKFAVKSMIGDVNQLCDLDSTQTANLHQAYDYFEKYPRQTPAQSLSDMMAWIHRFRGRPYYNTTFYEVLELPVFATDADIKNAYRRLARQWHPDMAPRENKLEAEDRFKRINEAYRTLQDEVQRKKYDATLGIGKIREAELQSRKERKRAEETIQQTANLATSPTVWNPVTGWLRQSDFPEEEWKKFTIRHGSEGFELWYVKDAYTQGKLAGPFFSRSTAAERASTLIQEHSKVLEDEKGKFWVEIQWDAMPAEFPQVVGVVYEGLTYQQSRIMDLLQQGPKVAEDLVLIAPLTELDNLQRKGMIWKMSIMPDLWALGQAPEFTIGT